MNYHYIDYMIKERRREELEACERRRVLNPAGYSQTGLIHRINGFISLVFQHLRELKIVPPKRLHTLFPTLHIGFRTKGVNQ